MLDYQSIVSVVSIVLYTVFALFAIWLCSRKAFGSITPWVFLLAFCILRILGNAFQLAVQNSKGDNKTNDSQLVTGAAICSSIGIGPLLIIATQLLRQANACLFTSAVPNQTHRALVTFDLCVVVSTILAINGGVSSFNPSKTESFEGFSATATLQAGICLYAATYLFILAAGFVVMGHRQQFQGPRQSSFTHAIIAILAALGLLLIRIIYSLLLVFDHSPKFSPFSGDNTTLQLCLQTVEEWLVVLIYSLIGITIRNITPPTKTKTEDVQSGKPLEGRLKQVLRYTPFVHWCIR